MDVILEAADWSYKGEGAANLVLSYKGTSPSLVGKVIRVHKVPNNGSLDENVHGHWSEHERLLWKDAGSMVTAPTKEIADQLYLQSVMIPLLGHEYVDIGRLVLVSREFLESVERNVLLLRPGWRVLTTKVNTSSDSVLLMDDHSVFPYDNANEDPCMCVEIKPKCGFLPSSRFISDKNAIKKSVPHFKMHQALKLQQCQISELSEYDPLDVFSGSRAGIHKAVSALFATPQNNLRVFHNGSLVHGSGPTFFNGEEAFQDHIKCFIKADDGLCMSSFVHLVSETIFNLGMMDKLLEVQKLDNFDIEGAIHAYYDVISQPCMVCRNLEEEELCRCTSLHSIPMEESVKIVKDYLISATAKDCSFMICFRIKKSDDDSRYCYANIDLESTGQTFYYKAHVIDLDLKPLDKMEYYYELDQKIVNNYNKAGETENGTSHHLECQR